MISGLIDKQDTFEIVDAKIAQILADESVSQQALAVGAGKDPELWKLRVFLEQSNPWEQFLNVNPATGATDKSPIVSVWFDTSNFDKGKGNMASKQDSDSIFNIDVYGYGEASDVDGGGHTPGDKAAALEAHRGIRLVRNILMSAGYRYLGLQGVVGSRWPRSITKFQPSQGEQAIQNIVGARFALNANFNEFSPQFETVILEGVSTEIRRDIATGEILAQVEVNYPLPEE